MKASAASSVGPDRTLARSLLGGLDVAGTWRWTLQALLSPEATQMASHTVVSPWAFLFNNLKKEPVQKGSVLENQLSIA